MQIETNRLTIRKFQESDANAFSKLAKNEEITRFLYWGPLDYEESKKYVLRAIKLTETARPRKYILAVTLQDGTLIGSVFLYIRNFTNRLAEISYLLDTDFWGKGYGSETLQATLKWAFQDLKMHRIFARADQANNRSVELLKRNHFVPEGLLRKDLIIKGKWRDSLIFSLLEDEFVPN
jgi:RimJ/RimL family protein N-acetyltransferase